MILATRVHALVWDPFFLPKPKMTSSPQGWSTNPSPVWERRRTICLLTLHPPSRDKQVRAHGLLSSYRLTCDLCQGTVFFSLHSCRKRLSSVFLCTFSSHKNLSQNLSEFKYEPVMVTSCFSPQCFPLPHTPARSVCVTEGCCSSAGTGIEKR